MAGRVITIAQQKGGAGKTTLAAQLAVAWARRGLRLALIDTDPQGSLAAWAELRRARGELGFDFAALPGWRAAERIATAAREADLVLVDSPPHAEAEARIAVRSADLVLVPVQPSPLDHWATGATVRLAQAEGRTTLAVLNRVPARSSLVDDIVAALARDGIATAGARLGNRAAFVQAMAQGRGVVETAPAKPAAVEVAALAEELLDG
jgi:chromosome partitioning protein